MSYSVSTPCDACEKKAKCTDRHVIQGAVSGIHLMPFGTGHLGCGTISIICSNIQVPKTIDEEIEEL